MAGFLLSASGLSIELRSIIRHTAAHPFGASAARALFNACGVSPSPGTKIPIPPSGMPSGFALNLISTPNINSDYFSSIKI
jgi:hypothetical protein